MLDANVLFAASTWPQFPYEVLQHAVAGDYILVLTPRIIAEAREAILEIARTPRAAWKRRLMPVSMNEYRPLKPNRLPPGMTSSVILKMFM